MFHLLNRHLAFAALVSIFLAPIKAQAQSVIAAPDGTGTNIQTTQQTTGSLYDISGGTPSGDGATLFHSFDQFGLLTGETARFTNPAAIENILGRVIGGEASIINGLLTVNGTANLYLLNPAGVLFGENARLNLGGDFSASTATGVAFGETLFDALGTTDLGSITGSPTGYVFGAEQASAVLNAGDLAVGQGQSLTLLGGQVINTGQLSAPGGEILVMAVPGENLVRLSQDGTLLDLELATLPREVSTPSDFTASTLPTLLTGAGDLDVATNMTLNADGSVSLSGSALEIPVDAGTVIVGGTLAANNDNGGIGIFGNRIALVNAAVEASGETGGGTVLIGGDLGVGDLGRAPRATATFIDDASTVQADAQQTGNGGTIIAWGTDLLRLAGQLSARGGVLEGNGGFIETSSLGTLDISTTPDISASNGLGGTWLLDPPDIRIVEDDDVTQNTLIGTSPFVTDSSQTEEVTLGISVLRNALTGGANVEVRTGNGRTPGDGDIVLDATLDYNGTGNNRLRLNAEGVIRILQPIFDSQPGNDALSLRLRSQKIISIENTVNVGSTGITLEARQGPLNEDFLGETVFSGANDTELFNTLSGSSGSKLLGLGNLTGETLTIRALDADQDYSFVEGSSAVSTLNSDGFLESGSLFGPFISPTELAAISNNFQTVTIGSSRDAGQVIFAGSTPQEITLGSSITFLTGSGRFALTNTTLSGADITFRSTQDLEIVGDVNAFNDSIRFRGDDSINIDNITSNGGRVSISSNQGDISVGEIITASFNANAGGDAGDVLVETAGNVVFASINAESTEGAGGNVVISAPQGTVRGTGVISDSSITIETMLSGAAVSFQPQVIARNLDATISTEGATENGRISITHGGGAIDPVIPFEIGDAAVNGTVGALTTGVTTLTEDNPDNPFFDSFTEGDIEIITPDPPGVVTPPEPNPVLGETVDLPDCVTNCISDLLTRQDNLSASASTDPKLIFAQLEKRLTSEFVDYLSPGFARPRAVVAAQVNATEADQAPVEPGAIAPGEPLSSASYIDQLELGQTPEVVDLPTAQQKLLDVQTKTGKKPALIYAVFGTNLEDFDEEGNILNASTPSDPLELLLVTAEGDPIYIKPPNHNGENITREAVITMAQRLRRQVSTPSRIDTKTYLHSAQTLYKWLLEPLQAELKTQGIDTISFITDTGLRSTPLAALHDGQQFIIETYNIGLMPSLSLTDLTYQDIRDVDALLTGTSAFADQAELPGVPVELDAISSKWQGQRLQGNHFILDELIDTRQQNPYGIIHLATHGEFSTGALSQSYIQLYDQKLRLHQLRELGLHQPSLELLTLSACQTALGSRSAELGFAGFAVLAGAKTSVASLWSVSDEASAGLMIEFYRQLQEIQNDKPMIKAEALRRAQQAMIRGDVYAEGDQLVSLTQSRPLPPELITEGRQDFSHPYYWAAFSLVGSPW
ncbi:MAG: CHAT domain-containing protein [Cyanobacteria bacterium P01_F01_bin.4]